ncbi:hypothetical protein TWF481_009441 [Arthrobotrys musiformis]|uniref:G domain-containing protein n=1 Tax=Arthrobotrys musiformis TaxID=47236 RepID=A0AAV9W3T1_9PEZI
MRKPHPHGAYAESSPAYTSTGDHALPKTMEHEGKSPWESTGSRAPAWSSQNESNPINSGSTENWSPDTAAGHKYSEDQTRSINAIRRKPVPGNSVVETEGGSTLDQIRKGTETMDSARSVSENSGAGLERRTENLVVRGSSGSTSDAKIKRVVPSTHSKKLENPSKGSGGQPKRVLSETQTILGSALVAVMGVILWILFSTAKSVVGHTPSSPVIAIMGETGAGKSSFIKALGGRDDSGNFPIIGHNLNSTTKKVEWYSATAGSKGFYILDTPGFDDSYMSDYEILEGLTRELAEMYRSSRLLTGIIYVHDVSKEKMGGTSHKSLRTFQKLVGERSMENVVLVTTHWRKFFKGPQVKREDELRGTFWAPMITRGSKILRHDGSQKSAMRIVKEILDRKPVVVKIVDEMVNKKMTFGQTDAGEVVTEGLKVLEGKLDSNVAALSDEIAELKKERKEAESAVEEKMERLETQWKISSAKERQEIEDQMTSLKNEASKQAERFNKQLTDLAFDKQRLSYQINDLKRANKALQRQLSRQQEREDREAAEQKKKKKEEEEQPGEFVFLIIGACFVFFVLVLIGYRAGPQ